MTLKQSDSNDLENGGRAPPSSRLLCNNKNRFEGERL